MKSGLYSDRNERLAGLEEEDCNLAHVEINEVFRLMSNVAEIRHKILNKLSGLRL